MSSKFFLWCTLMASTVVVGLTDRILAVASEPSSLNWLLLTTSSAVALSLMVLMPKE